MKLTIYLYSKYVKGKKIHSTKVTKMIIVHIINITNSDNILLIKIVNMMNMSLTWSQCGIAYQIIKCHNMA